MSIRLEVGKSYSRRNTRITSVRPVVKILFEYADWLMGDDYHYYQKNGQWYRTKESGFDLVREVTV